jgi:hypothetical protein
VTAESKDQAVRQAVDLLRALGDDAPTSYGQVIAGLEPWWTPDVACGVNIAVGFLEEASSVALPADVRRAAIDEAIRHLLEERTLTPEEEQVETAAYDEALREMLLRLDDKPFPEPI